jgi:hypothetical protein
MGGHLKDSRKSSGFHPNPAVHARRLEGPLWGKAAIVRMKQTAATSAASP